MPFFTPDAAITIENALVVCVAVACTDVYGALRPLWSAALRACVAISPSPIPTVTPSYGAPLPTRTATLSWLPSGTIWVTATRSPRMNATGLTCVHGSMSCGIGACSCVCNDGWFTALSGPYSAVYCNSSSDPNPGSGQTSGRSALAGCNNVVECFFVDRLPFALGILATALAVLFLLCCCAHRCCCPHWKSCACPASACPCFARCCRTIFCGGCRCCGLPEEDADDYDSDDGASCDSDQARGGRGCTHRRAKKLNRSASAGKRKYRRGAPTPILFGNESEASLSASLGLGIGQGASSGLNPLMVLQLQQQLASLAADTAAGSITGAAGLISASLAGSGTIAGKGRNGGTGKGRAGIASPSPVSTTGRSLQGRTAGKGLADHLQAAQAGGTGIGSSSASSTSAENTGASPTSGGSGTGSSSEHTSIQLFSPTEQHGRRSSVRSLVAATLLPPPTTLAIQARMMAHVLAARISRGTSRRDTRGDSDDDTGAAGSSARKSRGDTDDESSSGSDGELEEGAGHRGVRKKHTGTGQGQKGASNRDHDGRRRRNDDSGGGRAVAGRRRPKHKRKAGRH